MSIAPGLAGLASAHLPPRCAAPRGGEELLQPIPMGQHPQKAPPSRYCVLVADRITGSAEKRSPLLNATLGTAAAFQPRAANAILPQLSILMGPIFSIGEKKAGRKFNF